MTLKKITLSTATALALLASVPIFAVQPVDPGFGSEDDPTDLPKVALAPSVTSSFSGVATPGSPMFSWISDSAGKPLTVPVRYTVTYASEEGSEGFKSVEELIAWAGPYGGKSHDAGVAKANDYRTESPWDPTSVIPEPGSDGNNDGDTNSGCTHALFGWPAQSAQIRYTWKWMQTDTNGNGDIDSGDEFGWHLISYSVEFLRVNDSISPC